MLKKLLILTFIFSPFGVYAEQPAKCSIALQAYNDAATIRGLKPKREVKCFLNDKTGVRRYILNAIETKIPQEKLQGEEALYKSLGFLPPDFDYTHGIVDLYVSQLGGFYDPQKKYYVMAAWLPDMMQPTIAVHELTHALQDQYFNLETFIDDKKMNLDTLLARSALVEGDATAVMNDYGRGIAGVVPIAQEQNVDLIILQTVLGSYVAEGLAQAPTGLKNMLLFPYASGLRFVHSVLKTKGYKGIDAVFKKPPETTEEILHPEKYPAGITEYRVIGSSEVINQGDTISHEDVMGEFFISTWLTGLGVQNAQALSAASGWGGDRIVVATDARQKKIVRWFSHWDSEGDALEFEQSSKEALLRRRGSPQPAVVARTGADVTILLGID